MAKSAEEAMKLAKKRVAVDDAGAIFALGNCYNNGDHGLQRNRVKALELWYRAAELGCTRAYYSIGNAYNNGRGGVERDIEKANQYYELAAIEGNTGARHNFGSYEYMKGNSDRALKHWMISAGGGEKESLGAIQEMFKMGMATKEDYTQALRAYQAYLGEIKSVQRDEAATALKGYKYY